MYAAKPCNMWPVLQTGQGALQALSPDAVASVVKYGTSASSLTSTATGSAEVAS